MALGRISGPLLREDLLRDEVNLAFETNLLYLDVNTHAADVASNPLDSTLWTGNIGIRNSNPAYPLDVTGTLRATSLRGGLLDIDNVNINGNTITTSVGSLILDTATNSDNVTINSDVLINGDLHATGSITADGSLTLGDANTDNVVFAADINSDLYPNITDTYNLGGTSKRWNKAHLAIAEIGDVYVSSSTVTSSLTNGNLNLNSNGSGFVVINGSLTISSNGTVSLPRDITVGGNLTVTGDIIGGPLITDDIRIAGNRIETTASNSNLELHTVGTGTIELQDNTNVTGTFGVSGLSTLAQAQVSDLTSGRVTYASTSGRLVDSGNLTFSGTLLTVTGSATVTSLATLAQAQVSDLTSGRVTYASTSGRLVDSSNLTFNGTLLTVTGNETVTGLATLAQAQVSDLTSGRVTFAGTSGRLQDSSALTFANGTLTVGTSVSVSGTGGDITMTGGNITGVGNISTVGLTVSNNATVSGTLYVTGDIVGGPLRTDDIQIVGNRIETVSSNSNFEINTVGTGSIELLANSNVTGTFGVSGLSTLAQAQVTDLTSGRLTYASTSGRLVDSGNLTFNGFTLTVTGNETVTGTATLGNLVVNGTTTLSGPITASDNLTVGGTLYVTGDIVGGPLRTDDIQIVGNRIETTATNSNFEVNTVGTGSIELLANTNVTGNLGVSGNVDVTGNITLGGNIRIGDTTLDTINVIADFTSDLTPDIGNTFDLGSSSKPWRVVNAAEFNNGVIRIDDNIITTTVSNADLDLRANGTGNILLANHVTVEGVTSTGATGTGKFVFDTSPTISGATLTNHVTVEGVTSTGATGTGNIVFSASPTVTGTLTITGNETVTGAITTNNLTVNDNATVSGTLYVTGDIVGGPLRTDDIQIVGNRIETTASNSNLELHTVGTGTIELQDNTNVTGTFGVSGLSTLAQAQVTDLTSGRITYAGASGRLVDNENLTFSGSTLTVTGDETVTGTATLGILNVNGSSTLIGPVTASNNVSIAGTLTVVGDIVGGPLRTDDIQIVGNRIETTATNSNFEINTVGTGSIELLANTNVTGNLGVSGNVDVTGNITLGGNIRIGDTTLDTVTVIADFTSDLVPDVGNTFDLGTSTKQWRVVNAAEFNNNVIRIDDNTIKTTVSNANLELNANGSGTVELQTNTNVTGTLNVSGETASGTVNPLNLNQNRVTFYDGSQLADSENLQYDGSTLTITGNETVTGTVTTTNLSVNNSATVSGTLYVTGDIVGGPLRTDDIQIVGNRIETTSSNSNFEINTVGTGSIELLANSKVTGTFEATALSTLAQAQVSDLTEMRLVIAGVNGRLVDNADLTYNGFGQLSTYQLIVNSGAEFKSNVSVRQLTQDRITFTGTDNTLTDSANLTFSGTTLTVTGNETVTGTATLGNLQVNGTTTLSGPITASDNLSVAGTLTVTRDIVGGSLRTSDIQIVGNRIETTSSNSNFEINTVGTGSIELLANSNVTGTFSVSELSTLAQAQVSDLTSGRITYAGTSGRLVDSGNLTFSGSTLTITGNETVTGTATLGSLLVNGFTTLTGPAIASDTLTVAGTLYVTGDIVGGPLRTDDIQIVGNRIETTATNSNFEVNTVGTGSIELLADTNVTGNLNVSGSIDVTGDITLGGNIRIGDTTLDNVTVIADFTSDLIPNASNSYDLGTANKAWRNVYAGQIDVDGIRIDTTTISTVNSNANLELTPSGTGIVYINGTGAIRIPTGDTSQRPVTGQAGFIRFNNQTNNIEAWNGVTFAGISGGSSSDTNGDTLISYETSGNNEDIIRFFTGVAGLTPGSSIGSVEQVQISSTGLNVIRNLTVGNDFTVTGNATISEITTDDVRISGNRISTTQSNSNLELTSNGAGLVSVQDTLSVAEELTVAGTSTLARANVSDLTDGRITYAGASGRLKDSANLTFDGTTLAVTGNETISGTLTVGSVSVSGAGSFDSVTVTDLLINGRIHIYDNVIENTLTNDDLIIRANGTGRVIIDGAGTSEGSGNIYATDPLLTLNSAKTTSNTYDSGLIIERGTDINVGFIWDESADQFAFISTIEQGTVKGNVAITGYQDLSVGTVKLNSETASKVTFTDASKYVRSLDTGTTAYVDGTIKFNTGAQAAIPTGSTAQRPASPQEGTIRYNTTVQQFEGYADSSWQAMGFGAGTAPSYQGFLADGAEFEFELNEVPLSSYGIIVAINGVVQEPEIAYTVDNDILRFIDDTSTVVAPEAGDRIDVRFLSKPAVSTVRTSNFVGDDTTTTFDTGYTIGSVETVLVFVNSIYQDSDVYSVSGRSVVFDEAPYQDDRVNIVNITTIVAPDLPTKTYVDQQITQVSNTATDDAIAFAIALG